MIKNDDNQQRLLLVEDVPFLRYAFGRLLRRSGYDVMEAQDGRDALDRLAAFRPHVVVTDLMMPGMNGLELIRHLHDDPETAQLPVVAITADPTDYTEQRAREAGAVDFIAKPIDMCCLLERLRAIRL